MLQQHTLHALDPKFPMMLHMLSDNCYWVFFLPLRFISCLRVWLREQSDGGSRTSAGLQHPDVGGAAHRLHNLLCRDHPSLRHPAAAQRQEGRPGAGVRQVRHAWFCVFVCVGGCASFLVFDWLRLDCQSSDVCLRLQSGAPAQPHPPGEREVHPSTGEPTQCILRMSLLKIILAFLLAVEELNLTLCVCVSCVTVSSLLP